MLEEHPVGDVAVDETNDGVRLPPGVARFSRVVSVLRRRLTAAPGGPWRDPVIWGVAATSFGAYFAVSLFKLIRLAPSSYDLGIYTEFVKQLSQFHAPIDDVLGAGYNLEGDHFQIAVGVIAPFFRLLPSPATLLFFQALFASVSVFAVATAAFALTGRVTGRLVAFAYAFSWGLQQMIDFDFHEIALAVPLLAFSLSALVRRRPAAAIAWAVPLVFVKEDQGFTLAAIGGVLMASAAFPSLLRGVQVPPAKGRRDYGNTALWGGMFLVGWGLFWSTFAITVIIPHFNPQHVYRYFAAAGGTVGSGKPFSITGLLVQAGGGWPTKAQTLALLLLPTAFIALGSPVAVIAVPSLVLRFISTDTSYWGTAWDYNATVMPILFIAAVEAIGRWRRSQALAWRGASPAPSADAESRARTSGSFGVHAVALRLAVKAHDRVHLAQMAAVRHGGAVMAAVSLALAFQFPLSQLWQAQTYRLDAHVAAADAAMAVVPDHATVQTNLDLLAPLAARTDTFWIGSKGNPLTQYIVFDGVNSGYSPPISNVPEFIVRLFPHDGYVQVFDRDDVYVFHRHG